MGLASSWATSASRRPHDDVRAACLARLALSAVGLPTAFARARVHLCTPPPLARFWQLSLFCEESRRVCGRLWSDSVDSTRSPLSSPVCSKVPTEVQVLKCLMALGPLSESTPSPVPILGLVRRKWIFQCSLLIPPYESSRILGLDDRAGVREPLRLRRTWQRHLRGGMYVECTNKARGTWVGKNQFFLNEVRTAFRTRRNLVGPHTVRNADGEEGFL